MPHTMIPSLYQVVPGTEIISNSNDQEFGEEIVALFIAHANLMRAKCGLPKLAVGSLADLGGNGRADDLWMLCSLPGAGSQPCSLCVN